MIYVVAIILALCSSAAADWQQDAKDVRFALVVFQLDGSAEIMPVTYGSEEACREAADWASHFVCVPVEETETK